MGRSNGFTSWSWIRPWTRPKGSRNVGCSGVLTRACDSGAMASQSGASARARPTPCGF